MDVLELRNFLQSEGEELTEVATPTIDISARLLSDICDSIQSDGLDYLIQNLGTISNAFRTENDYSCSPEVLTWAVEIIQKSLERLHMQIVDAQGDVRGSLANIDRPAKHKFRKYMAVLFFLINQSFVEIERAVTAEAHNLSLKQLVDNPNAGGKRRGKRQVDETREESKFTFWFESRPQIIQRLWKVIAPPMHEIWEGNLDGSFNFMRCLTLALCSTIKNKAKRVRTLDNEIEDTFDVLGILAAKHQEQKGIMARLIPLLKGSEEIATIIAGGIDRMIQLSPDQAQNMVVQALSETYDTYMTRFDKESGQDKGFQAFLTELCRLQPKGAMHALPVIVQFLESESHLVRNAVLAVAYELLNWSWREMKAEEESQSNEDQGDLPQSRDNWLPFRRKLLDEILLLHMRDTNSFVRAKAVNILSDLVKKQVVYPIEAIEILKNVRLRLLDKTVTTRKAATSLVVDLVKVYPHIVTPTEEFFRKREQKIEEIVSTIRNDAKNKAIALYFIIKEFHLHAKMESFVISPSVKEKITCQDEALKLIDEFLAAEEYWKACETLYLCIKKWTEQLEIALQGFRRDDNDTQEELFLRFFKASHADVFPEELNTLELGELNYIAPRRVKDLREFLDYIQCCMKMHAELEKCQPSLRSLLELGTTQDKKEAVMFYAAICEAGFKTSQSITVSIINALSQLNAEELGDFVEPFKFIFIGRENFGPVGTVRKLLQLVEKLSESLVESLGGMIGQLYQSHILTRESVAVLWDAFSLSTGNWTESESRSAAYILGIIGQIERQVVTSNLAQLIEVGLGERGLADYELAKVTLQTILYGCRVEQEFVEPEVPTGKGKKGPKINKNQSTEGIKFPPEHNLFEKVVTLIEKGLKEEGNKSTNFMYPRVVELSMQVIYRMCTHPNDIVMRFLPNIHGLVFAVSAGSSASSQSQNTERIDPFKLSENILYRYMSFGRALLGAHITYHEQTVMKEIKKRKALLDKNKKKSRTASRGKGGNRLSNASMSSTASAMNQSNNDAQSEMDLIIGNIGFDAEADTIKTYIAKLLDIGFFRTFRVHVLFLCQTFDSIKSQNLKIGVVQALAKMMLACEASVNTHLDTLIKLWDRDDDVAVKLEILRASIRLTVKFPNPMEKMNEKFSSGLAHKDARLRKACMDYIQYLALSDLLKVRDQLSDCAACLCDEQFELRGHTEGRLQMARDFINQIAEKDNVLQNSIPDIISRLSKREDVTQESFQIIMKTLLNKIKKEKQLGGLVERIVGRFKGPIEEVRVCQDTAFCLTQIQQNEKTLKIMKDNLNVYADKLGDVIVWEFFQELLQAFKKLTKPELKMKIEEWEKDLEEHHEKCVALLKAEMAAKKKDEPKQVVPEPEPSSDEEDNAGGENGEVANSSKGPKQNRDHGDGEDDNDDQNEEGDEDMEEDGSEQGAEDEKMEVSGEDEEEVGTDEDDCDRIDESDDEDD